jgi:hypothetical protein
MVLTQVLYFELKISQVLLFMYLMIRTFEERWNVEYLSGVTNEVVELVSVSSINLRKRAEIPEPPGTRTLRDLPLQKNHAYKYYSTQHNCNGTSRYSTLDWELGKTKT